MLVHLFQKINAVLAAILCSTISLYSFAQNIEIKFVQDTVFTKNQIKGATTLEWKDFYKPIPEDRNYAALTNTNTEIGFKSLTKDGLTSVTVTTKFFFDRTTSCKKLSAQKPVLLAHEQLHFNLAHANYLFFLQKLKTLDFSANNYKTLIDTAFVLYQRDNHDWQSKYDTYTAHGRDEGEQAKWQTIIGDLYNKAKEDKNINYFEYKQKFSTPSKPKLIKKKK